MSVDLDLFIQMLSIDSTSGRERALADLLSGLLPCYGCSVSRFPADAPDDAPVNLLFAWGDPQIVFCTHLDTVPPYIAPSVENTPDGDVIIRGRGACDAKGQIISMYTACRTLAEMGHTGFGLLLLYGEETGSYGAKEYRNHPGGKYVIVGEPTDGMMVSASKGTRSYEVTIKGHSFHSGYPDYGVSAVERFVDFNICLRKVSLPVDPVLGPTTYNIGQLRSDNPQNILSDHLTFRLYFRTTFASADVVPRIMDSLTYSSLSYKDFGGDTPTRYLTLPGFETTTVAFGSDAPQLTNFTHKILCGPGSILVAHRPNEHIRLSQLAAATDNYIRMYKYLIKSHPH